MTYQDPLVKLYCGDSREIPWRMDSELSFARLTIQPIACSGGTVYRILGELHILPYPNPLKYGGFYWLPCDVAAALVDGIKASWSKEISAWKDYGLVKDEYVDLPTKYINTPARLI